jgi:glycosyltransferase involved in cell wall biosynthesis
MISPRKVALKELNLDDDGRLIIGWIARVTGVKNPMLALEVARAIPTVHFVMAGGGDLFEKVKSLAPSNVSVLGWTKAEDLFGASDIILSTSANEGMPIALIEAQLAGKPVVATDVGGVSEVIADHETGLVTNKDAASIAAGINSLILETQKRTQMSTLAISRARALFSIDQMVNTHVRLYKSIVN